MFGVCLLFHVAVVVRSSNNNTLFYINNDDDDDKMCNIFLISMYINCSICTGLLLFRSLSGFVCAIRCTCGARLILNVSFESHNTPTERWRTHSDVTANYGAKNTLQFTMCESCCCWLVFFLYFPSL